MAAFYGEEDRPVHTVLKSWRGSDSSDSLQLEQLSWEGFTSVTYCQPEYDRRSVWYLETTDPAFYTARGIFSNFTFFSHPHFHAL